MKTNSQSSWITLIHKLITYGMDRTEANELRFLWSDHVADLASQGASPFRVAMTVIQSALSHLGWRTFQEQFSNLQAGLMTGLASGLITASPFMGQTSWLEAKASLHLGVGLFAIAALLIFQPSELGRWPTLIAVLLCASGVVHQMTTIAPTTTFSWLSLANLTLAALGLIDLSQQALRGHEVDHRTIGGFGIAGCSAAATGLGYLYKSLHPQYQDTKAIVFLIGVCLFVAGSNLVLSRKQNRLSLL